MSEITISQARDAVANLTTVWRALEKLEQALSVAAGVEQNVTEMHALLVKKTEAVKVAEQNIVALESDYAERMKTLAAARSRAEQEASSAAAKILSDAKTKAQKIDADCESRALKAGRELADLHLRIAEASTAAEAKTNELSALESRLSEVKKTIQGLLGSA